MICSSEMGQWLKKVEFSSLLYIIVDWVLIKKLPSGKMPVPEIMMA